MHEGWSKYILRKAAKDKLPDDIIWRRNKLGFEAPTKTWLAQKNKFFNEIINSEFINAFVMIDKLNKNMDDTTIWKLYNIAVWAKKFNVTF